MDSILITKRIITSEFIYRRNRFEAIVNIDGEPTVVHVPNTGRCKEILIPGSKVLLRQEDNPLRKTKYDLIAVYKGKKLINIDSQIPNKVVEEALYDRGIDRFKMYNIIEREKTFGDSRFDFRLKKTSEKDEVSDTYYLEIKGVTLEEKGKTMFPDAPTERGKKHIMELIKVKKEGMGAGILFVIQMDNVSYFTPHYEMDKAFGEALKMAKDAGVDVLAFDCSVGENYITLNKEIRVIL